MDIAFSDLADLIGILWVLFITVLAYWHRDRFLYVLSGLSLLAYGFPYYSTDLSMSIILVLLGIYNLYKVKEPARK